MGVVTSKQPDPPKKGKRGLKINLTIVVVCVAVFVVWRNQHKRKDAPAPAVAAATAPAPATMAPSSAAAAETIAPTAEPVAQKTAEATPPPAAKATPASADEIDAFAKDMMNPKNGFYDPHYKVAGKFPEGWVVRGAPRWGNQETTIFFEDPQYPHAVPSLYYRMFPEPMPKSGQDVQTWLQEEAVKKEEQRLRTIPDYVNGEMKPRTIGDRPALSWTATYTRNGEPWAEYLTRIYTPNGTYLFFMHAPEKDLAPMIPRFERVITTTIMP